MKNLRLNRRKSRLSILLSLLTLSIALSMYAVNPAFAAEEIYMTPDINPPTPGPSVGFKWNVTIWLKDYSNPDVFAWQVTLTYAGVAAKINATRAWLASSDPTYIFAGRSAVGVAPVLISQVSVLLGDSLLGGVGVTTPPQANPAKIAIIEFEILGAPGASETLSTALSIDNADTYLLAESLASRDPIKTDGSYSWVWAPPVTQPYLAVTPTLVELGPIPPSAVGETFDIDIYIKQLDAAWELTNATFTLSFNTTVIDVAGGVADITINVAAWNGINDVTVVPGMISFAVRTTQIPSGDVLVATVRFTVMHQENAPPSPIGYSDNSTLTFGGVELMNDVAQIPNDPSVDGLVKVYALVPIPPPTLEVQPQSYTALHRGEVFNITVNILNLDASWRMVGAQFRLHYNSSILEVANMSEGSFLAQFPNYPVSPYTQFEAFDELGDPLYGDHVVIGDLLLPNATGFWNNFPSGNGTIVTITFNVTGQPPASFPLDLFDTALIDDNLNEIPHNLVNGFFSLPGLNVALTAQPTTSYQRTQTASMKFTVEYPDDTARAGTYYTANDLGTIIVSVYDDVISVANISLTAQDFNTTTNEWTVQWNIPWNAAVSANYEFIILANNVIDKIGSSGPPTDMASNMFAFTPTQISVPAVYTDQPSYKRGTRVTIFFIATYPDGSPVTSGNASISIIRPDGTLSSATANYVQANSRYEAKFWLNDIEEMGTWIAKLQANALTDGATPPNTGPSADRQTTFTVILVEVLDIDTDVGSIYFRGEIAEFYILTKFEGKATNATTITATLSKPDGTTQSLTVLGVGTGLYKTTYTVPVSSPVGTYTLVVQASYITSSLEANGASLKSFLLSSTFTGWNAWLTEIRGNITLIKTDIGTIKTNINTINATLASIEGDIATINTALGTVNARLSAIDAKIVDVNGTIVTVKTSVGQIKTTLDSVNGKLDTVKGDTATVKTSVGDVQSSLGGVQGTASTALYASSILSAIAAIVSILVLMTLRKKK